MRMINDWAPETKALLAALKKAGVTILSGDNGDDAEFKYSGNDNTFADQLTATDEAHLYVSIPQPDGKSKKRWLFLVYGNEPGVLVSDYTCDPVLDKVTELHYNAWEGRKQPKKPEDVKLTDTFVHIEAFNALRYFGPLNAEQIAAKLELKGYVVPASEITRIMDAWIENQPAHNRGFFVAIGFAVKTYKA